MAILCNYAVASLLGSFSLYAILNPDYDDGLIGKICYSGLALACYGVMCNFPMQASNQSNKIMLWFFIAVIVRELFVRICIRGQDPANELE